MRSVLRVTILLAVAAAAAGSATQQGAQPAPQPYPQDQQPYAQGSTFYCTDLDGPTSHSSLCFLDPSRCDRERGGAAADGLTASACRPQTPVSCFQLGGDPSPSMAMCAATPDDCDLWRLVDQDKNGRTGAPCTWFHAQQAAYQ